MNKSKVIKKINWLKIVANSLEIFFVTLAGTATMNTLLKTEASSELFLAAAIFTSILQFGICFCHEVGKAAETLEQERIAEYIKKLAKNDNPGNPTKTTKVTWKNTVRNLLKNLVMFD